MTTASCFDTARRLVAAGLSVLPIRADGSKAPALASWKAYQERLPTEEELRQWFRRPSGIAIVGGAVSGNLEQLDFDEAGLYQEYEALADDNGFGDLVRRLPLVETPSGGYHLRYRCEVPVKGNQKLAWLLLDIPADAEFDETGKKVRFGGEEYPVVETDGTKKAITIRIETRGEGGYALAPPSPAACHPSKRPYTLLRGDLAAIPILTAEEVTTLQRLARVFNLMPGETVVDRTQAKERSEADGLRPGDDYNQRGDVLDLLLRHGWKEKGARGPMLLLQRPGKEGRGHSATWNHNGSRLFSVFSSNAYPFEIPAAEDEGHFSPFAVYAILEHHGDYEAAAKSLYAQGYGERVKPRRFSAEHRSEGTEAFPDGDCLQQWILRQFPDLPFKIENGNVTLPEHANPKTIVLRIKRMLGVRAKADIRMRALVGFLFNALPGFSLDDKKQHVEELFPAKSPLKGEVYRCAWVVRNWPADLIDLAAEYEYSWSAMVEASHKGFSNEDRRRFVERGASVKTIRILKKAFDTDDAENKQARLRQELKTAVGDAKAAEILRTLQELGKALGPEKARALLRQLAPNDPIVLNVSESFSGRDGTQSFSDVAKTAEPELDFDGDAENAFDDPGDWSTQQEPQGPEGEFPSQTFSGAAKSSEAENLSEELPGGEQFDQYLIASARRHVADWSGVSAETLVIDAATQTGEKAASWEQLVENTSPTSGNEDGEASVRALGTLFLPDAVCLSPPFDAFLCIPFPTDKDAPATDPFTADLSAAMEAYSVASEAIPTPTDVDAPVPLDPVMEANPLPP
jgi:putative DNA primase/helicase